MEDYSEEKSRVAIVSDSNKIFQISARQVPGGG